MLRITVVGVALAISVAACSSKDRNAATGDTAAGGMAAPATATPSSSTADTMGAAAPGSTTTSSASGALDTMTHKAGASADTLANRAGQVANKAKAAVGAGAAAVGHAASAGAVRTQLASLSSDQVKQLQTALNNDGCNAGKADGIMGKQTRQGVECDLKKHGISSTNVDSLYKVLNLSFK